MKRAFAIAVIAEMCIALAVLHSEVKDFFWTHPWWHSFLVLIPTIAVPILAIFELFHSKEANKLRAENIRVGEEANRLRGEQSEHVAAIAKLQEELNKLQAERNAALGKIAVNTTRVPTQAETNAAILRKYIGRYAQVTEGSNSWGAMGAVIAEVNDNNVLTLFVPSGMSSSTAFGQRVRCDKLHVIEETVGSCPVQINIVERYGNPTYYGEAKSWDGRNTMDAQKPAPRGNNVFNASYRKNGAAEKRGIFIYSSTDGSANLSLVTFEGARETGSSYCSKLDTEKKFAVLQIEWLNDGWRYDGGGGGNSLFLLTKP